jgi:hypothetical protein
MKIETVTYQINWAKFRRGYSFFVPCIDEKAARKEIAVISKRLKIPVVTKVVIEEGIKGLRVWRVWSKLVALATAVADIGILLGGYYHPRFIPG